MLKFLGGFVAVVCLAGTLAAQTAVQSAAAQDEEFLKGAYLEGTQGLTLPKVRYSVHPRYTSDALRAKIQGVVEVQAIVVSDGTVARARVMKSLDKVLGLDDEALHAVRQWTFEPGLLAGKAVPVAVSLVLEFKIH